jgi:hypothetical protein
MLNVLPAWRRRGVGSALFAALTARAPGPYFVREFLSDPDTVAFYRQRGFVTGEIATEGTIRPKQPETANWVTAALQVKIDGVRVIPLAISGLGELAAARAIDDLYLWIHPHSPPQQLDDEPAVDFYLGDAREGAVYVAVRDSAIVGAGVLSRSPFVDDDGLAHLAFCGVGDPGEPDAQAITRLLVAHLLALAREREWAVEVEANSPHRALVQVVETIPGARLFRDLTILVSRHGS